jgi:hypothetical protein
LNGTYTIEFEPGDDILAGSSKRMTHEFEVELLLATSAASAVFGYGTNGTGSEGDGDLVDYYSRIQNDEQLKYNLLYTGGGLKAQYFNNPNLSGSPDIVRIDPCVNVQMPKHDNSHSVNDELTTWPLTKTSEVSVRWDGLVKAPHSGMFSFILDLGFSRTPTAVFYFDDRLIALDNTPEVGRMSSISMQLQQGVLYKVRVEVMISGGDHNDIVRCRFEWQSERIQQQIIPSHLMFPSATKIDQSPLNLRIYG